MTDRRWLVRLAPLALVLGLALAMLVPEAGWMRLSSADRQAVTAVERTLDELPDRPLVLVAFDPDLGTYGEIRATVRSLLGDLLRRQAGLAFVSLTPEGRALLLAELDRLERLRTDVTRRLDLGFVPGAEAAVVAMARGPIRTDATGAIANRLRSSGPTAVDALVVVGGNDLGPRTWVEQFLPRVDRPMVAVAPTVLLPELQPYLASGQVDALLATPRDGAAYRESLDLERLARVAADRGPAPLAVLVGLLVAVAVLGQAVVMRTLVGSREAGRRDAG